MFKAVATIRGTGKIQIYTKQLLLYEGDSSLYFVFVVCTFYVVCKRINVQIKQL